MNQVTEKPKNKNQTHNGVNRKRFIRQSFLAVCILLFTLLVVGDFVSIHFLDIYSTSAFSQGSPIAIIFVLVLFMIVAFAITGSVTKYFINSVKPDNYRRYLIMNVVSSAIVFVVTIPLTFKCLMSTFVLFLFFV